MDVKSELKQYSQTEVGRLFEELIHERLNEYRRKNDTDDEDTVKKNQGAIQELKWFLKTIFKHDVKSSYYSGGYTD